jgi:hypothetical protein
MFKTKKKPMIDGIKHLRTQWRIFVHGIKNLWRWLPVVWKDRGWDQSFIYTILAFKLRQQAKSMRDADFIMEAQERAAQMDEVAQRLENLNSEFEYFESTGYEELEKKYHGVKYEFVPTNETKEYFTLEYIDSEGNIITNSDYIKQYKKERAALHKKTQKQIESYRKETFKMIADNIETWWW